jgi:hypothetical protein
MGDLLVTLFLGGWLSLDAAWVREVVSLLRAVAACPC